ncbi:MAG: FAD-dependent oxidoreductase, partial [Bacteroidales bacterium]|nr:FAD-dependent oxidoreductase [Bacteroidales bacterium]
MKRRAFINTGFLTLGGMLIGRNFTYANAMAEVSDSLRNMSDGTYDLVINGAGLSGFFAALEAAKKGLKVLVVDKRTSPGYDIAAKRKLWLKTEGLEKWDEAMLDLFLPKGELVEMLDNNLDAPRNSRSGNELLLFAGSIKKGMLRSLLVNKVDVLLMTDVCGIITDKNNKTSGVVVASKHGVFSISCGHFVDASCNTLFTRDLFQQKYSISDAGFIIELEGVSNMTDKNISVNDSFGVLGNQITLHKGKKAADQYFLEYRFPTENNDLSSIEQKARNIAFEIGKKLPNLSPSFSNAIFRYYALECSHHVKGKIDAVIPLKNYDYFENQTEDYSCDSILQMAEEARKKVEKIKDCTTPAEMAFVHYAGSRVAFKGTNKTINENGQPLPLSPFPVETLNIPAKESSIIVVGGGTAGVMAALGVTEKGFKPTVVEYFNDMGGTRSLGGVQKYYYGNQKHPLIKQFDAEIRQTTKNHHMNGGMPRCCHDLKLLLDKKCTIINGAIFCGVEVVNKQLKS